GPDRLAVDAETGHQLAFAVQGRDTAGRGATGTLRRRQPIIGGFVSASRTLVAPQRLLLESQPASLALTKADTCAMSARPVSSRFSADMTLPMSWDDLAPAAAIASVTVASTSAGLSRAGR